MCREILDHTDVLDAGGEGADTASGDLDDLADLAVTNPGLGLLQRRVVALDVPDAPDKALGFEGSRDGPRSLRWSPQEASRSWCGRQRAQASGQDARGRPWGRQRPPCRCRG